MVIFENAGVIDRRAIITFGLSAKETANPIGFFGTGLKYAIAILMRDGMELDLITGGKKYSFEKKVITSRGKPFEIITMDGEELPFTTKLGQNWELWQAFRELYCNSIDEGGSVDLRNGLVVQPDRTYFVVRGRQFEDIYHDRHLIVLSLAQELRLLQGKMEIYDAPSRFIYYRNIRVCELPAPGAFTYNLTEPTDLTEDRTLKYPHSAFARAANGVARLTNPQIIRKILTAPPHTFESAINYGDLIFFDFEISPQFTEVLGEEYHRNNDLLNASARQYFTKKMNKEAVKNYVAEPLSFVEQQQFERAVGICKRVFPRFTDFKIMVVKTLGQATMALADENARTMVISKAAFAMGTKYLCSTMIEEYTHLDTGYRDETRQMQTHLFDTICTLIEDHVLREPI